MIGETRATNQIGMHGTGEEDAALSLPSSLLHLGFFVVTVTGRARDRDPMIPSPVLIHDPPPPLPSYIVRTHPYDVGFCQPSVMFWLIFY